MKLSGFFLSISFTLAVAAVGCGGSSSPGGAGGNGGSGGGTGGTTGGNFMSVAPCAAATDYTTTGTEIDFDMGGSTAYTPKCLKVAKGATVTFVSKGGDFGTHPLEPSKKRGDTTNNPIKETLTGTMASFTFPTAGYFAYYCKNHGFSDDGSFMAGAIWVQ
jgi:plastocyanin